MLTIETIDINGAQSLLTLSNNLKLNKILPNKVTIWKFRNSNPLRKSYINNKISIEAFDALIKLAVEMSKALYPYIREILQSRDDFDNNPYAWNDFKKRFIELTYERLNINSMRVKKIIDPNVNDNILVQNLLTLALCSSDKGFKKLRTYLLNF